MSVSYLVRYRGRAADPAAFLDHYRTRHAAILRDYPGIEGCVLHHPVAWSDPVPVRPDGLFLLAELRFASAEALDRALASETRLRSRADFNNFPRFEGEISHQAVESEILFSR